MASDAELHDAINDGEREVEAVANDGFELLRTFGLARPPVHDPRPHRLDLIEVAATGADTYVVANGVLAGAWAGRRLLRRHTVVAVMGARRLETRASSVAVCNGQFAAPARWIAPRAHPSDGRLAVLVDENGVLAGRLLARRMPLGEHVPHRRIHQLRPLAVSVEGPRWPLEADGLPRRGRLPARFHVVPGGLTLWM